MDGGVVSTTVTLNESEALAPTVPVTVQVTVVGPSGNLAPEAGAQTAATGPSSTSSPMAV